MANSEKIPEWRRQEELREARKGRRKGSAQKRAPKALTPEDLDLRPLRLRKQESASEMSAMRCLNNDILLAYAPEFRDRQARRRAAALGIIELQAMPFVLHKKILSSLSECWEQAGREGL